MAHTITTTATGTDEGFWGVDPMVGDWDEIYNDLSTQYPDPPKPDEQK